MSSLYDDRSRYRTGISLLEAAHRLIEQAENEVGAKLWFGVERHGGAASRAIRGAQQILLSRHDACLERTTKP